MINKNVKPKSEHDKLNIFSKVTSNPSELNTVHSSNILFSSDQVSRRPKENKMLKERTMFSIDLTLVFLIALLETL